MEQKILVIVNHPDIKNSMVNKRWIEELEKHPDKFVVHHLDKLYPDSIIDVQAEQKLVEQFEKIVFQFPYYWFNSPALLKKWLDDVLTHGWAYGSKSGFKMAGKKIAMAISLGVDEAEYRQDGIYKYTLQELLRPFELSFEYIHADYHQPFAWYGLEYNASADWIEKSVPLYLEYLGKI